MVNRVGCTSGYWSFLLHNVTLMAEEEEEEEAKEKAEEVEE